MFNLTRMPVAHAYVVDGECEQIEWGVDADLPDDPALVWLYDRPLITSGELVPLAEVQALQAERDQLQRMVQATDTICAELAATRAKRDESERALAHMTLELDLAEAELAAERQARIDAEAAMAMVVGELAELRQDHYRAKERLSEYDRAALEGAKP